jgi:hypothetical protein
MNHGGERALLADGTVALVRRLLLRPTQVGDATLRALHV